MTLVDLTFLCVGHCENWSLSPVRFAHFFRSRMAAIPDISLRVLQRSVIWWLWRTEDLCAGAIHTQLLAVFGNETYSIQTVRSWLRNF